MRLLEIWPGLHAVALVRRHGEAAGVGAPV